MVRALLERIKLGKKTWRYRRKAGRRATVNGLNVKFKMVSK